MNIINFVRSGGDWLRFGGKGGCDGITEYGSFGFFRLSGNHILFAQAASLFLYLRDGVYTIFRKAYAASFQPQHVFALSSVVTTALRIAVYISYYSFLIFL